MQLFDDRPEPTREVWHFVLLILVGFMVVGSLLLSDRPPTLASFLNVAPVGVAPREAMLRGELLTDDWSVTIHRSDWKPRLAALLGRNGAGQLPRLGWVVREWSFLGLPLLGFRQGELALFREDDYGYRLSGMTDEQLRVARGAAGWFPVWRYLWGWLAVAAVGAWIWLEFRWQARRRAILGLI